MGIGINVKTGEMVGKQNWNNDKLFFMVCDTLVGKANTPHHDCGDPRTSSSNPYSLRERVYVRMDEWLMDRQSDVISGNRNNTEERAFDKDGNVRVMIDIQAEL